MGSAERVLSRFKRAGGTDFSNFVPVTDPKAAFRQAIEHAEHESGHGGYSGTISEKRDFEIRRHDPMSHEMAHRFVNEDLEHNDKWGPAFAVPIGETAKGKEKHFKVKVPGQDEWSAKEAAAKAIREKFGTPGVNVSVKSEKVTLVKEGKMPELIIEKGGPEGFKVVGVGIQRDNKAEEGPFSSRAEAAAAFKQFLLRTKHTARTGSKYQIVKFKTTDQFTIGDTAKSMHLYQVEGTAALEKSTGKIIGWLFYGIASS